LNFFLTTSGRKKFQTTQLNIMVILEAIVVGAIIYGIHKNRKYKKMKRLAQANGQQQTTTTVTTTYVPGSSGAPAPQPSTTPTQNVPTKVSPMPMQSTQGASTSTRFEPISDFEEVQVHEPLLGRATPQSSYEDIKLTSIVIKDEFGRSVISGRSGLLTLADGGFQALSIPNALSSDSLLEGKQYFIDAVGERGQRFNHVSFFYYGIFEGGLFFSAVSPVQASSLHK
jgi:hypothetical protein